MHEGGDIIHRRYQGIVVGGAVDLVSAGAYW